MLVLPEDRSTSPFTVTPSRVPPEPVATSFAPPDSFKVPFFSVPPARFQEPVVALSVSVVLVLSKMPDRFTVPVVRLNVPKLANVNEPPRLVVELVALIVPVLLHVPLSHRFASVATMVEE